MSKLQLLAQKRKQQASAAEAVVSPDKSTAEVPASPSNGLSKLMQKRKLASTGNASGLSSLLLKKKELHSSDTPQQPQVEKIITQPKLNSTKKPEIDTPVKSGKEKSEILSRSGKAQQVKSLDIQKICDVKKESYSIIQSTPTHILPRIIFSDHTQSKESQEISPNPKRRKIDFEGPARFNTSSQSFDTNSLPLLQIPNSLAQKITKNFNSPSPDDKRKVVESLSEKVSKVNLDNEKEKGQVKKKDQINATKPKSKINIQEELERKAAKPLLSLIVIGHVDSGKSTTIGRLLYDLGIVDSRTLHKLTRDAELAGKGSFSLAWVMDQTPEERSRGVTVDIVQTQFETTTMRFAVIDSPGHRDYVPQMINGITQADVAVVIIDATSDLIFEASNVDNQAISSDTSPSEIARGQTFEQLTIARNLGIRRVLVVVNKMDVLGWDEERFHLIQESLTSYLVDNLNFSNKELSFVPASGFNGDNIVKKSDQCPWYKESLTLFQYLEKMNEETHRTFEQMTSDANDPFVLTITDVTSGSGSDTTKKSDQLTVHGRVNSGILQPGESVKLWPSGETAQVDNVVTTISQVSDLAKKNNTSGSGIRLNEKITVAGEFVELKLRKVELPDAICIGDVATKITSALEKNVTVTCSQKLNCELRMFGLRRPVLVGTPFVLFRGNVSYAARLSAIEWVETKVTNEDGTVKLKKNKKRKHLSSSQRARVTIETEKPVPIVNLLPEEVASENEDGLHGIEKLRRIVLRKEGMTVGAGIIVSSE